MAEEQKSKPNASQVAGNVKDGVNLAKDTARLAAGDVTAVKDLLMNKIVIGIILAIILFIALISMCIGASITGVVEYVATSWEENWDENYTDQAVASGGNAEYLSTTGWVLTLFNTMGDTASNIYDSVVGIVETAFTKLTNNSIANGAGTRDNSQLLTDGIDYTGKVPQASDYEVTLQAILESAQLDQALTDRLEMIKTRVKQRGLQIEKAAKEQYLENMDSEYVKIAQALSEQMETVMIENDDDSMVFYAGYNEELSEENFNFDLSVFELSSLQALKILTIFSVQHDCQLSDIDMWTLMDYCGWYDSDETGTLDDVADTIYEVVSQTQTFGNDIGTVIQEDQSIPVAIYEFPALEVPIWTGTCAPQWYYEEIAQIRLHNQQYEQYATSGNVPAGMISWAAIDGEDSNGITGINTSRFAKLKKTETFGIIDRLFYSAENNLTVNRSEYTPTDEWTQEQIEALGGDIAKYWTDYVWSGEEIETPEGGNTLELCEDGTYSLIYNGEIPPDEITVTYDQRGILSIKIETFTEIRVSLRDLEGNIIGELTPESLEMKFSGLTPTTEYEIVKTISTRTVTHISANKQIETSEITEEIIDTFITSNRPRTVQAYELYISVNLSFQARTVDEIAFDLLGIWPGSLSDTVQVTGETSSGNTIGETEVNGTKKYTYCLEGGTYRLIAGNRTAWVEELNGTYSELKRAHNITSNPTELTGPIQLTTITYQYGISKDGEYITSVAQTPSSGWKTVSTDGEDLLFDIAGTGHYIVYAKITVATATIQSGSGTTGTSRQEYLFTIDTFTPGASGTTVSNGEIYAADHLGNENLLLNWTDTYTDSRGVRHTLNFSRMTGYQYESYVDMVMALCELLEIPYDDWEPAIQRAADLKLPST